MPDDVWMLKHPIRPGGVVSPIPYCGYDRDELESITDTGYVLSKNGEEVPLPGDDIDKKENEPVKKTKGRAKK